MRFVGVMGLAVLVGVAGATGAAADEGWDSFLAAMSPYDDMLALSQQFADRLRDDDSKGIGKLADDVRDGLDERYLGLVEHGFSVGPGLDETETLEAWVAQVTPLDVFADELATRAALNNMRSCPMAGILLRNLILQVADDGRAYRVEADRVVIDDTGSDTHFAIAFARCQILEREAWAPAPIGYHVDACRPDREDCPEIVDR